MKLKGKVYIVFNPKGGSASESTLRELQRAIARRFPLVTVESLPTHADAAETRADILAHADGASLFIAMGGDGTARVVAEALLGTNIPMTVFPGGTGNLFARNYYNYPRPQQFAAMIANGSLQAIDLLEVEYSPLGSQVAEKRFVLVGLGFGKLSDAITDANPTWKRWLGSLAYVTGMVNASFDPGANEVTFTGPDGQPLGDEFDRATVSAAFLVNTAPPHLINMSRGCTPSDGLLDLVVLTAKNFSEVAHAAAWLGIGKPERSRCFSRIRTDEVIITSTAPMHLNIDGDSGGRTTSMKVRVVKGAVRMVLS